MTRHLAFAILVLAVAGWTCPVVQAADSVGAFINSNSYTILKMGSISPTAKKMFHFGFGKGHLDTAIPFAGDFDEDGDDSVGYYDSLEGIFYLAYQNDGVIDEERHFNPVTSLNAAGSLHPVALDWDEDGDVDVGVFDDGNNRWYLEGYSYQGSDHFVWGWQVNTANKNNIPVVGNWDLADAADEIGLYNYNLGEFQTGSGDIFPSGPSGYTVVTYGGVQGQVYPIVGNWDGSGADELGYYDIATNRFYRQGTTTIEFADAILNNFSEVTNNPLNTDTYPLAGNWADDGGALPTPYAWDLCMDGCDMDPNDLADAVAEADDLDHVNSLLVARYGELVLEEYFNGYSQDVSTNLKSVTKSVLSAMFGTAVRDGYISGTTSDPVGLLDSHTVDETIPITEYDFPTGAESVTLLDLMTMTSGYLDVNDDPLHPLPFKNGGDYDDDWVGWIVEGGHQLGNNSGWDANKLDTFNYYDGNPHLAAEILRRYLPSQQYDDILEFAMVRLFSRLGIAPTRWDHEPSSNVIPQGIGEKVYFGPYQMWMRPRDMLRFGQLYLDEGIGENSDRILDSAWVRETTKDLVPDPGTRYGAWWWREYWNGSQQCFGGVCGYHARGYGGQKIYIFPGYDLVVVITSHPDVISSDSDTQSEQNDDLLESVLAAIE